MWQWGLRCRSAAAWLLGLRVRIPLTAWTFVCCVCSVSSGLCDGLIIRSEESYRICVFVWSTNLNNGNAKARFGLLRHRKRNERKQLIQLTLSYGVRFKNLSFFPRFLGCIRDRYKLQSEIHPPEIALRNKMCAYWRWEEIRMKRSVTKIHFCTDITHCAHRTRKISDLRHASTAKHLCDDSTT